jgi:hypothetical protein
LEAAGIDRPPQPPPLQFYGVNHWAASP